MREGYAVQILKWGDPILTIERTCLSGAQMSSEDEEAILDAAEHLKSFVGESCNHEFEDWSNEVIQKPFDVCRHCGVIHNSDMRIGSTAVEFRAMLAKQRR